MSLSQSIESLKKVDLNNLDFNNIGSWPGALKVIVCVLVFVVLLLLGYQFHLKDLQSGLVRGSYHDLATFVSSVAGLPRIVTLNDFVIEPISADNPDLLTMNIVAKTYRYNDAGGQE